MHAICPRCGHKQFVRLTATQKTFQCTQCGEPMRTPRAPAEEGTLTSQPAPADPMMSATPGDTTFDEAAPPAKTRPAWMLPTIIGGAAVVVFFLCCGGAAVIALVGSRLSARPSGQVFTSKISPTAKTPPTAKDVGTITFAEGVGANFTPIREGREFTTGRVYLIIRGKKPFGTAKMIVVYSKQGEGIEKVLGAYDVSPTWDICSVDINLIDPGVYQIKAQTDKGELIAEDTVTVIRK